MSKAKKTGLVNAIKQNHLTYQITQPQTIFTPYVQTNIDYSKRLYNQYQPAQDKNIPYSNISFDQIKNTVMKNHNRSNQNYISNYQDQKLDQNYMSVIQQELMRQQYEQNDFKSMALDQIEQQQAFSSRTRIANNSNNLNSQHLYESNMQINPTINLTSSTQPFMSSNQYIKSYIQNSSNQIRKPAMKTLKEQNNMKKVINEVKPEQKTNKKVRFYVNLNQQSDEQDHNKAIQEEQNFKQEENQNNWQTNLSVQINIKLGNPNLSIRKVINEYKSMDKKNSTFLVQLKNNQTATLNYWEMRFFYKDELLDSYQQHLNR